MSFHLSSKMVVVESLYFKLKKYSFPENINRITIFVNGQTTLKILSRSQNK